MRGIRLLLVLMTLVGGSFAASAVDSRAQEVGPRAQPPEFTDEDRAVFFDNAFDRLHGDRPQATAARVAATTQERGSSSQASIVWADLIAADVLETEIKRQATELNNATRSTSAFKAGGFRDAADSLGILATLFAVTAQHDRQPRWRDVAASLRDELAEASEAADTATDEAHSIAEGWARDLSDLIRGARPDVPPPAEAIDWSELASRSTLMRRMEAAEQERLGKWTASQRELRRNAEDARHEAQVLAALAEAIVQPEAYDYEDADYRAFAQQLREASVELAAAAEAEDQAAATRAMNDVSRSCVDCHAAYRG